jgi:hypothetical protein
VDFMKGDETNRGGCEAPLGMFVFNSFFFTVPLLVVFLPQIV